MVIMADTHKGEIWVGRMAMGKGGLREGRDGTGREMLFS